jgi:hypothetical protein
MRAKWIWLAIAGAALSGGAVMDQRQPVLVELFTSEGCSSCPPADALLEKLDHDQPVSGAQIIVLSEHVDYWNQLGWKDPYSSSAFSERQANYARALRLEEVYTPQMVVDGAVECPGADAQKAVTAIRNAIAEPGIAVRWSAAGNGDALTLDVDPLPNSKVRKASVYLARAADSAVSDVLRGENRGLKLHHVSVVSEIKEIGHVDRKSGFKTGIPILNGDAPAGSKLVAFVQEPGQGRVLGAGVYIVPKP